MNWDDWQDEEVDAPTERESARLRREATQFEARLEAAVWKMLERKPEELSNLGLEEEMLDAIEIARSLKPSKARNRQVRLITKFLRQLTTEEANHIAHQIEHGAENQAIVLRYAELWRAALLHNGDVALSALLQNAPALNRQHLRQLCRTIAKTENTTKKNRAYKELFQILKSANLSEAPPRF